MKKIICLWGGPGTGKSTTCAAIFSKLKKLGYNCEMNREYIKDWVWESREFLPGDQNYIFAKQARKERLYMKEGLDFIVSDSPMAMSILYGEKYDKYEKEFGACRALLKQHHSFCKDHGYKIDHFFLVRQKSYETRGRYQTEDEARSIDMSCKALMKELGINYTEIICDENVEDNIVNQILNGENN